MKTDRIAAWVVLLGAGGTMASFNIWHSLHSGMNRGLAWLVGVIIVVIVMGTSHVAASGSGRARKLVMFGVMIGAMILSVRATGDVVRPAFGPLWWLFGLVVDSAALVALHAIMTPAAAITAGAAADITAETAGVSPPAPAGVSLPVSAHVSDDADAKAARAAYRKSLNGPGRPLSQRALGEKFGKSQTWGRDRINEVKAGPAPVAAAR